MNPTFAAYMLSKIPSPPAASQGRSLRGVWVNLWIMTAFLWIRPDVALNPVASYPLLDLMLVAAAVSWQAVAGMGPPCMEVAQVFAARLDAENRPTLLLAAGGASGILSPLLLPVWLSCARRVLAAVPLMAFATWHGALQWSDVWRLALLFQVVTLAACLWCAAVAAHVQRPTYAGYIAAATLLPAFVGLVWPWCWLTSPGGADPMSAILARAGYPERSTADLRAALAGTWAAWRADTAFREETVEVDGGSGDLDLLFRLLAASFRPPAPDPGALRKAAAARAEELRLEAGPEAEFRAAAESSGPVRGDPEELETWTAEAIRAAWEDRFGNPGDFEFLAVGDFDLAEAERSAREHLGALPAAGIREPVPPPPPAPAPGFRGIDAGSHPRGRILVLWPLRDLSDSDALRLEPLARALETRLFRRIREDLADTYDVYCDWAEWPDRPGSGEFRIELEAAPGRARALAEEVLREVAAFGAGGAGTAAALAGFSRAADDEAVYRELLDGLIAERAAGGADGRGTPRRIPRKADEPLEGFPALPTAPAARLLVPERAAVFVLGWD